MAHELQLCALHRFGRELPKLGRHILGALVVINLEHAQIPVADHARQVQYVQFLANRVMAACRLSWKVSPSMHDRSRALRNRASSEAVEMPNNGASPESGSSARSSSARVDRARPAAHRFY